MAERTDDRTRDVERDTADSDGDGAADESVDPGEGGIGSGRLGVDRSAFDRDAGVVENVGDDGTTASNEERLTESGPSRTGRAKRRAASVFSPSTFLVHLAVALIGVFVLGNVVPVLPFAGFVGLLLMTGLLGTLSSEPRYLEVAVAGGTSGALALFLGSMGTSILTGGMLPLAGAVAGALTALVGFYAGRDVRDGVTKDL